MHAVEDVDPVDSVNVPAEQGVQVPLEVAPVADEYVWSGHSWQAAEDVAPVALLQLPAGQLPQLAEPGDAVYVPGPHGAHREDSLAPVTADDVPTEHSRQPLRDWPAWSLNVPAGQRAQDDADVAPADVPYHPAAHCVQLVDPDAVEYDPTGHCTHTDPDAYEPAAHALQVPI